MEIPDQSPPARFVVPNLRWWIGALLFASTVINYIDRQTLNVLAPYLKAEYHWTNSDFALVAIGFRVSHAVVPLLGGRFTVAGRGPNAGVGPVNGGTVSGRPRPHRNPQAGTSTRRAPRVDADPRCSASKGVGDEGREN